MAFGRPSKPSKRWVYGALAPLTHEEWIIEQICLCNRYRNELVALERGRREAIQEARRKRYPDLERIAVERERLREEIGQVRSAIRSANIQQRSKGRGTAEQRQQIADLQSQDQELRAQERALRDQAREDADLLAEWDRINEEAERASGPEMYECWRQPDEESGRAGLWWGCLNQTKATVSRSGDTPRFRRTTGEGRFSVQVQATRGLASEDVFGEHPVVQIEPVDLDVPYRRRHTVLHLAADGRGENKRWIKVPFLMHRPLPPGTQVKWVELVRFKQGPRWRWEVQFVLAQEEWPEPAGVARSGRIALDVGWHKLEDRLRVAVWEDEAGNQGEISIPQERLEQWARVDAIQTARADNFNAILAEFRSWLSGRAAIPDWLRERTATIAQWTSQSQARLASLVLFWREQRFAGNGIYERLEAWRFEDRRRWVEQTRVRVNVQNWREDHYRCQVKQLRAWFREMLIEDVDWAVLQRTKEPEDMSEDVRIEYRRMASVGRLLQIVRESGLTEIRCARNTTRRCHACRKLCTVGAELIHTCEHCGVDWDVDVNACRNLLIDRREQEDGENAA